MKLLKIFFPLVLVAAFFATMGCATAQPSGGFGMDDEPPPGFEEPFFFIQMSDPQFGMFGAKRGQQATDFQKEINNFRMAIAEANRLKPKFVVITGDLIQNPGDRGQIKLFNKMIKEFDSSIPVHLVAGNHDAGNKPTPETVAAYKRDFANDLYAFTVDKSRFIVLNSCLIHRPGRVQDLAEAQMIFLETELKKASKSGVQHIVLFMHHPLFLKSPGEKDGYFVIPKVRRAPILELLKKHNVSAVFAGHWHGNSFGKDGKLQMVTTGPVGKPLHEAPSGFRVIKVYPERISHKYHGLGKIPYRVKFSQ